MKTIEERAKEHLHKIPDLLEMTTRDMDLVEQAYIEGAKNEENIYKPLLQDILNLYHSSPTKEQIEILYHKVKKALE